MIILKENVNNVEEHNYLFAEVGWGCYESDISNKTLENTMYSVSVYDDEKIIGYGRLIGDGICFIYIHDVMVLPQYQNKKIGAKIMNKLLEEVSKIRQENPYVRVYLGDPKDKEKFYLEKPSMKREIEIIDYLNEYIKYNSNINGTGGLDKIFEGYTFEQALDRTLNMENEEYAIKINRCPGKTFLLIRENDNYIVGSINVRWNLNESMKQFGGNIGYGIRPTERGKGYNKINLYLGLLESKKLGLDKVMISCDASNLASDMTLKSLGGMLERTEIDPSDGVLTNVYWFDVDKCLERYKIIYSQFINITI